MFSSTECARRGGASGQRPKTPMRRRELVASIRSSYTQMLWTGCEEEGGVPSRSIKTGAGHAGEEGTLWTMFAESTEVAGTPLPHRERTHAGATAGETRLSHDGQLGQAQRPTPKQAPTPATPLRHDGPLAYLPHQPIRASAGPASAP